MRLNTIHFGYKTLSTLGNGTIPEMGLSVLKLTLCMQFLLSVDIQYFTKCFIIAPDFKPKP